jgi:hypothetical protein
MSADDKYELNNYHRSTTISYEITTTEAQQLVMKQLPQKHNNTSLQNFFYSVASQTVFRRTPGFHKKIQFERKTLDLFNNNNNNNNNNYYYYYYKNFT